VNFLGYGFSVGVFGTASDGSNSDEPFDAGVYISGQTAPSWGVAIHNLAVEFLGSDQRAPNVGEGFTYGRITADFGFSNGRASLDGVNLDVYAGVGPGGTTMSWNQDSKSIIPDSVELHLGPQIGLEGNASGTATYSIRDAFDSILNFFDDIFSAPEQTIHEVEIQGPNLD